MFTAPTLRYQSIFLAGTLEIFTQLLTVARAADADLTLVVVRDVLEGGIAFELHCTQNAAKLVNETIKAFKLESLTDIG